ncbi:MAG: hypothetical protein DHS20C19_04250 [Acidimicrobiales bacterium]|nr:MAG: hypothetical protein DHS20C19_04250 [Acidimicrobiales bacterium]
MGAHVRSEERGQATPLMVVVVLVALVAAVVVGQLGASADDAARARTAADAAALAGADGGAAAAMSMAAVNGGELEFFRQIGSVVEVVVRVGAVSARARAERTVEWVP